MIRLYFPVKSLLGNMLFLGFCSIFFFCSFSKSKHGIPKRKHLLAPCQPGDRDLTHVVSVSHTHVWGKPPTLQTKAPETMGIATPIIHSDRKRCLVAFPSWEGLGDSPVFLKSCKISSQKISKDQNHPNSSKHS